MSLLGGLGEFVQAMMWLDRTWLPKSVLGHPTVVISMSVKLKIEQG
jgi:hypothetical protein